MGKPQMLDFRPEVIIVDRKWTRAFFLENYDQAYQDESIRKTEKQMQERSPSSYVALLTIMLLKFGLNVIIGNDF